ncbi:MAG TPA: glycosyltransferase family 39 protein [Vicinamibacterales bacterium]
MKRPRLRTLGAAYVATWVLISWLTVPALDSYGDMVENYAWSQAWAWGTFRHPPLFAWMVGAWFSLFPTQVWAYYLLSYVNAWAGIVGILWLARLWVPAAVSRGRRDVFEMLVLLFAALSLPFSNLAAKFNADTVLLSLWPWTAYAFFAALHAAESRRRWKLTLLLAVMATAAMLGKYYSGLLLASLLIISIAQPEYRRWYRTVYPYAALGLLLVLLLPHTIWEARAGFPFLDYLEGKVDERVSVGRIALFLLSGIYYLPASWLAWLIVRRRLTSAERKPIAWAVPLRPLVLLCILPAIFTTAFNVFARIHLTTHWAIPVWFGLPVMMAVWLLPDLGDDFEWKRFERGVAVAWVVLLAGALIYTAVLSVTGDAKYSLARLEMVKAIERRFVDRFPSAHLAWAGGTWPESGALAFFGAGHPRALPGVPDDPRALVNPYESWRQQHGVLICYASGAYAREGTHDAGCESQTRAWLQGRGLKVDEESLTYHADGWRFRRAQPKNITVFWVPPARGKL